MSTRTVALVGGAVVLPTHVQADGVVVIDRDRIAASGPRGTTPVPRGARVLDVRGFAVAPGLVDLQVNGFGGVDVFDASPAALDAMTRALAREGTTSFVPTLVTSPFPALLAATRALADATARPPAHGAAETLGLHVEGPFLSETKRGAHPARDLRPPRRDAVDDLLEAMQPPKARRSGTGGAFRTVTLAPELPGAQEAIRRMAAAGVHVALGHSVADAGTAQRAADAGARHVTHLFNAMGPVHHRAPGLAGWALGSSESTAGLIADGHHVDRWMVAAAWHAMGADRIALVSDAIAPAGLPLVDGASVRLESGLGRVNIRRSDGLPRAENAAGDLAGSLASLAQCVRWTIHVAGIPLFDAIRMASATPARLAGVAARKGALAAGHDADVLLLDPDLRPARIWVRGREIPAAAAARSGPGRSAPRARGKA